MEQARITMEEVAPIMEYYNASFPALLMKMHTMPPDQFNERLTLQVEQLHDMTHRLLESKKLLKEEITKEYFQKQMDVAKQQFIDLQNFMINALKDHMAEFNSQFEESKTSNVGDIKSAIGTAVNDLASSNETNVSAVIEQHKLLVTLIQKELTESNKQVKLLQAQIITKDSEIEKLRIQAPSAISLKLP